MRRLLTTFVTLAVLVGVAEPILAQTRSIDEGPLVRRQLLYRSSRLELEPSLGHTLNDPYRRSAYLNGALNYHLTNTFSLGFNVAWGFISYNSNITDDIETASPSRVPELGFADNTLLTNIHLGYVPFYGKFNFLELGTVNWDFHLIGGVGGALVTSDQDPELEGFKFGPVIGAGWRFFWSGSQALSINLVDHMFSTAEISREGQPIDEAFTHTVLLSIGVSFFVTGELRVSR